MNVQPQSCLCLFAARRRAAGFSLIELIGVLAVVAIAAALIIPSIIRRVDNAARIKEGNDLLAISNSIALNVMRTRVIPSETAGLTNWARFVADWTRTSSNQVAINPRRNARAFLVDNGGWFQSRTLPYVQGTAGSATRPVNARVILLSSMDPARPLPQTLPARPSATEFNAIWDAAENVRPGTTLWTTDWGGRGEDLVIQRIDVGKLFHHLILVNRDPPGRALFSIDANDPTALNAVHAAFYLNGTDLGLYPTNVPVTAQIRLTLTEDKSFVFQGNWWGNTLTEGDSYYDIVASEFANTAAMFMISSNYAAGHKGNQEGAVVAMFNFMLAYQLWANQCPQHFPKYGRSARSDWPEWLLMDDAAGMGNDDFLNKFSGPGLFGTGN